MTGTEFEWAEFWNAVVSAAFTVSAVLGIGWQALKVARRRWDASIRPVLDAIKLMTEETNTTTKETNVTAKQTKVTATKTFDTVNHGRLDRMEDQLSNLIDGHQTITDRLNNAERGIDMRFDDVSHRLMLIDQKLSKDPDI